MTQYVNEYGTLFAVREHNGAPALMCKSKAMNKWSLSAALAAVKGDACTTEDLQEVLDEYARAHGWPPINGFPSWAENIVANFVSRQWVQNLSDGFSAKGFKGSYEVKCREGSSCGDGFVDTGPQGITIWKGNSHRVKYTWADFVRRCKAAGLAPEPHQDKEDAPCNTKPTAPTGAAAATTAVSAAPQPSQAAGTSTGSPGNSADASSCPSAEPARQAPAALTLSAPDTAPMNLPAFDYTGLDADTAEKLRGITDRVMELSQTYAWGMAYQVGRAHDLLCGDGACETVSQAHKRNNQHSENTFTAWCAYIGVERRSAYNLLNAYRLICKATPEQQRNLQLAPAKLLYEAGKKDVPGQLADAVMNGDITTHKQYQDLLAKLKAEQTARAEAERALATEKQSGAGTSALLADEQQRRQQANEARIAAENRAASAESRARAAENRAAGAQKLAEQRGSENAELKAKIRELENQPRDVAVVQPGEEQIEAWRQEGADRMAATLQDTVRQANREKLQAQSQIADLQEQLATARPDADACQRTVDTLYETAENLRMLLRSQLKQAQLSPSTYGQVVAHVLLIARALMDTVRVCSPDGYDMDSEEDDDFA